MRAPCQEGKVRMGCSQIFRFEPAAGAGDFSIGGRPDGVVRKVAFSGSHRMDSASYELVQTHKVSRAQGMEVMVGPRCGEETRPVPVDGLPHLFIYG